MKPICVISVGAQTAIGLTAPATAAAVRASISGFEEHPYMIDKAGEPMIVAAACSETLDGVERWVHLARCAALEALTPLEYLIHLGTQSGLIVGLPASRPGLPPDLAPTIQKYLSELWDFRVVETIACGHAASLLAIKRAMHWIQSGQVNWCLVGGVDSYMHAETLEWLDEHEYLNSQVNKFGFIPGEAAGFCLLVSCQTARHFKLNILAHIVAVASASENNTINTDTVCIGEGLSHAFSQVLNAIDPIETQIHQVFCDLNGQRYRADEYGFSVLRTREYFIDPSDFIAPAECWGDVGAATGVLLVNLVTAAAQKGYALGSYSLLWSSSESGERCAALLYAEQDGNNNAPPGLKNQ